jgi:hypothetical protein
VKVVASQVKVVASQVKVVEVRGCEFRFWIQNEGRAPEIPQAV